ncbi:probable E3 ubiquitin-protein ligase TRIML2 [Bos indicus x Bos taurus]|nr:probable E3 ubiquitin-protein ligase TRIML2 [Bos indicus x Bos taurus]
MSKRPRSQLEQDTPGGVRCETRPQPPQLFRSGDQMAVCGHSLPPQERGSPVVVNEVPEAAEKYRKLFQEMLDTLKEKLEAAKIILADEQERMVMMQKEEQNFKEMIESEYSIRIRLMTEENEMNLQSLQGRFNLNLRQTSQNQLMEFATNLKEKFQETLQRLNFLGRENMKKLKESEVRLSEQICSLQQITTELERKCRQPASVLLQNAKYALERSESLLYQFLQPAQITDLSLCQITGMSKMLKVLQRPITLDPKTAHPYLVLSEDLRSVRLRNVQRGVPGHPERFDFSATVLGAQSFTSGRHYWEVDVGRAAQWQLGVYRSSTVRNSSGNKVLLTGSLMGTDHTFWTFPPFKRVSLREQVHRVGVFLDYEYEQISFYDATKSSLIYNFSYLAFQGALRPIFSLSISSGGVNSDSLSICLPHVSPCSDTLSPQPSSV